MTKQKRYKSIAAKTTMKRADTKQFATRRPKQNSKGYFFLPKRLHKLTVALFVLFFAGIGSYFLITSNAVASNMVYAQGTKLYLNGSEYKFTGVNAYQLATNWNVNYGCGGMLTDAQMDAFFASLRPNSMVRFWGFQRQAYNKNTRQIDFSPIDRVVNIAGKYNQRLIITLGNQWADCDGGNQKDFNWYNGGYKTPQNNPEGSTPLSYWDWVRQIVPRYANSTTVGMWELLNEPEVRSADNTCSNELASRDLLRSFFDTVGNEVHRMDPNHLVSSGTGGYGECGQAWQDYQYVHSSSGIDIGSYHDYGLDDQPMPGDQWNGLQAKLDMLKAINKPMFIGEAGIKAHDNLAGCVTLLTRQNKIKSKMDAQISAGISGYVPWNWAASDAGTCDYDFTSADPLMTLLHDYPLPAAVTADTTSPNVTITSPVNNSVIRNSVYINATVSDNIGVTKREVWIDGKRMSTTIPYTWNSKKVANGLHTITVYAFDAAGNRGESSVVVTKQ